MKTVAYSKTVASKMKAGKLYIRASHFKHVSPETFVFSRMASDEDVVVHPRGEPDMQSSWVINARTLVLEVEE